ncbi:hypothetical protein Hypma_009827 [Hypsizygus marmoreus]|uniref:F-box domain-containing protein n=1 Tax=Hypsizygus marmoreus TaxID=39966 RepID=A0A369JU84_HYPMA|nr:hypothetical protein Hypma_009827 [Hypsizygus marmoreus]
MNSDLEPDFVTNLLSRGSSLNNVFRTNNPPSSDQRDQIINLVRDIENYIDPRDQLDPTAFDSEPRTLQQLKELCTACKSALSSLRQMPPEIISYIFSKSIPAAPVDFDNEPWDTLDVTREPWTLAQISSSWRAIAFANREIWSFIRLNLEIIYVAGKRPPALATLQCCLERSGNHALSIYFKDSYAPMAEAGRLLIALLSHSSRWINVTMSMPFVNVQQLAKVRLRLPLLHHLDISAYGANTFGILDAFEVAPRLREASLSVGDPCTVLLPWSQLTKFQGWVIPSLDVLSHASQVVDCSLSFDSWYTKDPTVPVVRSHALRRLQINLECALDGLEAPLLEDLHIGHLDDSAAPGMTHVTSFIRRSSCSLKSLLFSRITLEHESDLIPLLESTPSLAFLQVRYGSVNWDALMHALTITGTRCLLPNLKTASFVFGKTTTMLNPHPHVNSSKLMDMIESRFHVDGREGVTPLESIALIELAQPLSTQLARLAVLKEQGLKVIDDMQLGEDIPPVVRWTWVDYLGP